MSNFLYLLVFAILVPLIVRRKALKDNLRTNKYFPSFKYGSAQFQAFITMTKWLIVFFILLAIIANLLDSINL
jgi:hypothetical protein